MLCNAPFWLKLAHSAQILAFSTKIFPASWLACNSLRMAAGSDPTWDHQKFPKFLFLFYNIFKLIYNVSHSFLSLFNVKWPISGAKVCFQPIVYGNPLVYMKVKSGNLKRQTMSTYNIWKSLLEFGLPAQMNVSVKRNTWYHFWIIC